MEMHASSLAEYGSDLVLSVTTTSQYEGEGGVRFQGGDEYQGESLVEMPALPANLPTASSLSSGGSVSIDRERGLSRRRPGTQMTDTFGEDIDDDDASAHSRNINNNNSNNNNGNGNAVGVSYNQKGLPTPGWVKLRVQVGEAAASKKQGADINKPYRIMSLARINGTRREGGGGGGGGGGGVAAGGEGAVPLSLKNCASISRIPPPRDASPEAAARLAVLTSNLYPNLLKRLTPIEELQRLRKYKMGLSPSQRIRNSDIQELRPTQSFEEGEESMNSASTSTLLGGGRGGEGVGGLGEVGGEFLYSESASSTGLPLKQGQNRATLKIRAKKSPGARRRQMMLAERGKHNRSIVIVPHGKNLDLFHTRNPRKLSAHSPIDPRPGTLRRPLSPLYSPATFRRPVSSGPRPATDDNEDDDNEDTDTEDEEAEAEERAEKKRAMLRAKALELQDEDEEERGGGSVRGNQLSEEQIAEFKEVFALFDTDGGGTISVEELGTAFTQMGLELSEVELAEMIGQLDQDGSGTIDFPEFLSMLSQHMGATPAGTAKGSRVIDDDAAVEKEEFGAFDFEGEMGGNGFGADGGFVPIQFDNDNSGGGGGGGGSGGGEDVFASASPVFSRRSHSPDNRDGTPETRTDDGIVEQARASLLDPVNMPREIFEAFENGGNNDSRGGDGGGIGGFGGGVVGGGGGSSGGDKGESKQKKRKKKKKQPLLPDQDEPEEDIYEELARQNIDPVTATRLDYSFPRDGIRSANRHVKHQDYPEDPVYLGSKGGVHKFVANNAFEARAGRATTPLISEQGSGGVSFLITKSPPASRPASATRSRLHGVEPKEQESLEFGPAFVYQKNDRTGGDGGGGGGGESAAIRARLQHELEKEKYEQGLREAAERKKKEQEDLEIEALKKAGKKLKKNKRGEKPPPVPIGATAYAIAGSKVGISPSHRPRNAEPLRGYSKAAQVEWPRQVVEANEKATAEVRRAEKGANGKVVYVKDNYVVPKHAPLTEEEMFEAEWAHAQEQ